MSASRFLTAAEARLSKPKPTKQAKKQANPRIDKAAYLEWRAEKGLSLYCDCGCGSLGQDMHHCFIGRRKGYIILDDYRNIAWVTHDEHIARVFDCRLWRREFWIVFCRKLGTVYMLEWIDAVLAAGLDRSRIDWL